MSISNMDKSEQQQQQVSGVHIHFLTMIEVVGVGDGNSGK